MPYRVVSLVGLLAMGCWTLGCGDDDGPGDDDSGAASAGDARAMDPDAAPDDDDGGSAGRNDATPPGGDDGGGDRDGARPIPPDRDFDGGLRCPDDCDDDIACSIDACDGTTGTCVHTAPDNDGDGVGDVGCVNREGIPFGTDCDDSDPYAGFPDGPGPHLDVLYGGCDGYDNDCDGTIDEGCDCITGTTRGCGFSVGACSPGIETCEDGRWGTACDGGVLPTDEVCGNVIDDDCNGETDEGYTGWRVDLDGDGHGAGEVTYACGPPDRWVPITPPPGPPSTTPPPPRDCDDTNPDIGPGAVEVCNGRDDDCDGLVDEGVEGVFYYDEDGDGFGYDGLTTRACTMPPDYVPTGGDCDGDPIKFPGAPEICDDFDNDCDEAIDEGCPCTTEGATRPCGRTDAACTAGTQRCFRGVWLGICEGGVRPATETCNRIDDDCDGVIDEGLRVPLLPDRDGDGWGDDAVELVCPGTTGYVDRGGDCDGTNPAVRPDAPFASEPRPGDVASWDWSCDGWEQLEHPGTRVVRCGNDADPCAYEGHQWLENDEHRRARCGQTGTLYRCSSCVPTVIDGATLQRCR